MSTFPAPPEADFDPGDAHPGLVTLTGLLERIARGRHAAAAADVPDPVGVAVLPLWAWVAPGPAVGRKGFATDGGVVLLPMRVIWDGEVAAALALCPTDTRAQWSAAGVGRSVRGHTTIVTSRGHRDSLTNPPSTVTAGPPATIVAPRVTRRARRIELAEMAADGEVAMWDLLAQIEPWVEAAMTDQADALAAELVRAGIAPIGGRVVSSETVARLVSDFLWSPRGDGPPQAWRVVERALTETFAAVDPLRWLRVTIARDARDATRSLVGDPRVGPRVRQAWSDYRSTTEAPRIPTVEDFLAFYRARHPGDHLGVRRLAAALVPAIDPMAHPVNLDVEALAAPQGDGDHRGGGDEVIGPDDIDDVAARWAMSPDNVARLRILVAAGESIPCPGLHRVAG